MSSRPSPPPRGRAGRAPAGDDVRPVVAPGRPAGQRPSDEAAVPRSARHHLPVGARGVDRRGLTAAGAVLLALVLGLTGAAVDLSTGRGLRLVFAVCFVAGCALAALLVHREDLKAVVVMPPLLHAVIAVLSSAFGRTGRSSSGLKGHALEAVGTLVLGAPVLLAATGAALLVAVLRALSGRHRHGGRPAGRLPAARSG